MIKLPLYFDFDLSKVKAVRKEGKHIIIEANNMKLKVYDVHHLKDNDLLNNYLDDNGAEVNTTQ